MSETQTLEQFLTDDHRQLDALLTRALSGMPSIDIEAYEAFRRGLLRHIAREEKLVMPHLRRAGIAPELLERLRSDHSTLAALLIPQPRPDLLENVRAILLEHNKLEEGPGGMYAIAMTTLGGAEKGVLQQVIELPEVKVSPHRDGPEIEAHLARVLSARDGA